jgi:hypothetical protein
MGGRSTFSLLVDVRGRRGQRSTVVYTSRCCHSRALGGTVTRLLAVVADVVGGRPGSSTVAGVDPLRRAERGDVADAAVWKKAERSE